MLYTIKSADATATISSLGAELQSLCHSPRKPQSNAKNLAPGTSAGSTQNLADNTDQGEETLWQGDPAVWSGRAPVLFPIVGALKNNQYTHEGKSFTLARHGFARKARFCCAEQTADSVTLKLQADSESLSVYPWQFELTIRFSMRQSTLIVGYTVANQDTTPMLFTIGSHPAFALQHAPSEYAIHFSKAETLKHHPLTADGLLKPGVNYLQNSDRLPLSESLFDDDALIFKNIQSDTVSLFHQDKPLITVDTGGAPHLGIWAKPAARFVCIEPWFGFSDSEDGGGAIADKPEMKSLRAGDLFSYEWSISLHS